MRVIILTAGSQGDIQPYLALAVGLKNEGYKVRFVANSNFAGLAARYELDFYPIQVDSFKFSQSAPGQAWLESDTLLKLIVNTPRVLKPVIPRIFTDVFDACREGGALIYNSFALPFVYYIAKHRNIPCIPVSLDPLPTRAHPALPLNIRQARNKAFNKLTHVLVHQFAWQVFLPITRRSLKGKVDVSFLDPMRLILREQQSPVLCAYSSMVVPRPADLSKQVIMTGYWFLDPDPRWQPNPELVEFIEAERRPIYIGFGSMGNPNHRRHTANAVIDALAETDQRAILAAGWSELGLNHELPRNVFVLESIPHRWLFPRMSAIVHHAGPGTTAAALSAGKANVTVPHFASQYFYGYLIADLGVGPEPIARRRLTSERLARAISAATQDRAMQERAGAVAAGINAEDGVKIAIREIRRYFG